MIAKCRGAYRFPAPEDIYHLDDANPYRHKYGIETDEWGEEAWVTKLKQCTNMTGTMCITDLLKHIIRESQKCFKNTCHASDWMFYHDALHSSQMRHAEIG